MAPPGVRHRSQWLRRGRRGTCRQPARPAIGTVGYDPSGQNGKVHVRIQTTGTYQRKGVVVGSIGGNDGTVELREPGGEMLHPQIESMPIHTKLQGAAGDDRAITPGDGALSREDWEAAVRYLLDRGAQFVLCRHNKHPLWKRWQRRWPTLDEILSHWGPVGVVPASIKMTVLDADIIGNSACLETMLHRFPHVAVISSSKPYRGHVWIRDEIPRTNGKFACLGVKGDVRSGSGYAILWGDGATKLAAAMKADLESPAGKLHIGQMEEWILTQGGKLKTQRNPIRRRRGRGLKQGNHYRLTAGGMPRRTFLADARIGERNDTLFETLRIWAYGRRRGDDYAEWRGLVRDCADRLNDEIPEPLPSDEVGRTADSVADFCWTRLEEVKPRGGTVDRDVQARRGRKSGQARRWKLGPPAGRPETVAAAEDLAEHVLRPAQEVPGRLPGRHRAAAGLDLPALHGRNSVRSSGWPRRRAPPPSAGRGPDTGITKRLNSGSERPRNGLDGTPNHQQRPQRRGAGACGPRGWPEPRRAGQPEHPALAWGPHQPAHNGSVAHLPAHALPARARRRGRPDPEPGTRGRHQHEERAWSGTSQNDPRRPRD